MPVPVIKGQYARLLQINIAAALIGGTIAAYAFSIPLNEQARKTAEFNKKLAAAQH